jgi:sugar lactone lactonase YvrE
MRNVGACSRRFAGLVIAALSAALVAACGGGSDGSGPKAPAVIAQPSDQSVVEGSSASFSLAADGAAPLAYQWSSSLDGTTFAPIVGAIGASYNTGATALIDNATRYRVMVSNGVGSVLSSTASLTVTSIVPAGLSLLAGDIGGRGNFDGMGTAARFNYPLGVAVDSAGNVYVADFVSSTIRRITPAGLVSTIAGSANNVGGADGMGSAARFNHPRGVAVDGADNIYVADTENHTIRKITVAGVVTTLAGSSSVPGSADGIGGAALFNRPLALAVDAAGTVYVADSANFTIRKIMPSGVVSTIAGSAGVAGSADGMGAAAGFGFPSGIGVGGAAIYLLDAGNKSIRGVTPGGVVTTLADLSTDFSAPQGIVVDAAGTIYVADTDNQTIRKIATSGAVTTLAGSTGIGGSADGTASAALFFGPQAIAIDTAGAIYVADSLNQTVRKITAAGAVSTLAGLASKTGGADGAADAARFLLPQQVAVDRIGNSYVADTANHTIRKISPAGVVTTLAGSAGISGSADGSGGAALFNTPYGVAVDAAGTVYVADTFNHTVRRITSAGIVTTLAGSAGVVGAADGTGSAAGLNYPEGIAVDMGGTVYVADTGNNTIRKISSAGVVTTLAGSPVRAGSSDGIGAAALFNAPRAIAVDAAGTAYVADTLNYTIRRITPSGAVTTLAGSPGIQGDSDGTGDAALFYFPQAVTVDVSGAVYVADSGNYTIRKITPSGAVSTVIGAAGEGGIRLGAAGRLYAPAGVAVIGKNRLVITSQSAVLLAELP